MQRSGLLAAAVLLTLCAATHARTQVVSDQQPSPKSPGQVAIRPQPDSPLRVTFAEHSPEELKTPHVILLVENVSASPVNAYWIGYSLNVRGELVTAGVGANAASPAMLLQPGGKRLAAVPNPDREKVDLWVDFVEFADGAAWGGDRAGYAERLAAQRAGARAETERLLKLLADGGPRAVVSALAREPQTYLKTGEGQAESDEAVLRELNVAPAGRSPLWLSAFRFGVRSKRLSVMQAYDKGGLAGVEAAVRQPYDLSERRSVR